MLTLVKGYSVGNNPMQVGSIVECEIVDTPEVEVSMKTMNTITCADCTHEWIQPAEATACPACRSTNTSVTARRFNDLKRV